MPDTPRGPGVRGRIFTALTGNRAADVSGAGRDVRGMLLAIGGPSSKTQSGIDLTRAASALGVSRRTAERWVKAAATGAGQRPSPAHAKAMAGRARQAATTKAGRRAALGAVRAQRTFARGARLAVTGRQGPRAAGRDYLRDRTTMLDLDPADAEAMLNAYEQGGDKGFLAWATGHWGQEYLDGWGFETVEDVTVQAPYGGGWR